MEALLDILRDNAQRLDARAVLDIFIISSIFFWLLLLLRGTTAMSLLRGIALVLIAAAVLGSVFDLTVLQWVLRNSLPALLIAIPIIFQPEIRRALERLGRTGLRAWTRPGYDATIEVTARAAAELARNRHGALLVLERETGLEDYIDTGVRMDAELSEELLASIFFPNSPLHDGAAVIRESRVVAASCTLPLSERGVPGHQGTRHRAGLGIAERTDAVAVVVSEETGDISVACNGRVITRLDEARLRTVLADLCGPGVNGRRPPAARREPASSHHS
ncbi:MAG TPA: diadenylate cyclase CdaA [Dehalococcoidia bacterium]